MASLRPPVSLGFWHPASLIATALGCGRLAPAPGTWGSLAALGLGWLLLRAGGWPLLAVAAAVLFVAGVWAAERYSRSTGTPDPQTVVVDEVVGMWLTLLAAGSDWRAVLAGFVFFRVADIAKPWPARRLERDIPGGLGIMLDDIAAAAWAAVAVIALRYVAGW